MTSTDPSDPITTELGDGEFLRYAQAWVEGSVEVVHLPGPGIDVWINEDGKGIGLPVNEWATAAAFHGGAGLAPWDNIVGDIVLSGGCNDQGDTLGLTDEQVAWIGTVEI